MTYLTLLKKYWYIVLVVVLLVSIASFAISVVQKPEYRSSVRLLVIQKQGGQLDAYTAARSAETVAGLLSKIIYTSTFFDQVMAAGFNVDSDSFADDPEKRKEQWEKAVVTKVVEDTGTVQVSIYDEDRHQAEQLAYAVAYVMISKGDQYHGGDNQIEIKMVDTPITSENPVRPSVARNTAAGFLLGLLASLSVLFLISERVQRKPVNTELEVESMPKPKEIKEWKKQEEKQQEKIKKTEKSSKPQKPAKKAKPEPQPVAIPQAEPAEQKKPESKGNVSQRFSASLENKFQEERDIPYELPQKKKKDKPSVPSPKAQQENVKSKFATGMKKLTPPPEREELAPGEVVYQLVKGGRKKGKNKDQVANPQDDKYSPDRVDKWIKTGKFE